MYSTWIPDYSSRQKDDKAMRKLDLQHRMLELKHQWKLLRAEDDSNSDDSTLTEVAGDRRRKARQYMRNHPSNLKDSRAKISPLGVVAETLQVSGQSQWVE